jgi:TolB-like protein
MVTSVKGHPMKFKRLFFFLLLSLIFISPSTSITQTRDADKIYKVAILPFMIHSQENLDYVREGIYDILSSRITAEGRIVVVERSLVERAFYEERPTRLDEGVAKKIGMRVGADYIVLGSLTKIGDYISLDARLISITEEKPPIGAYTQHKGIEDVMVKMGDFAQDIGNKILGRRPTVGRATEPRHPYLIKPKREMGRIAPEGIDFRKSQTLPFEIRGLDIGDVDGDKKNELVAVDKHNVYIFTYDGEKLKLLQRVELGSEHNFLSLDVADVNRNGFAEIIVSSVVEDDLRSFVLEYEEGKLKKVTENERWFFRVLDHPKEGPILMGQNMGSGGIAAGPIYKFVWKKKSFKKGPKMDFPAGTKIFGFTVADIRSTGTLDMVKLEDFERLTILSKDGKFQWRSSARFGGTNIYYDTLKTRDAMATPRERIPSRQYIPGRILIRDLNGSGTPEVIAYRNIPTGKLSQRTRSFETGEIYSLVWEEDNLITDWKTREINGYITDYQVKDADNDGQVELVVGVCKTGGSVTDKKVTSNILFFKLF